MKINYHPNPLRTTIELDEHEKKELWYKIVIDEYKWAIIGAKVKLEGIPSLDKTPNIEEAIKELRVDYFFNEGEYEGKGVDARADEMLAYYIEELQGWHCGDCTCVPCSCSKCHAEDLLEINTIKGLGKHSAYKIDSAFSDGKDENGKNKQHTDINRAIEYLKNYEPKADWNGWEAHVPRWKKEAEHAYNWLVEYKNKHFAEVV